MDIHAKRVELIQWILNLSEEALRKVDAIREKDSVNDVVAYSTDGKPFTKEQYVKHINEIRDSVKNGAKTYTTKEVREYVLGSRK